MLFADAPQSEGAENALKRAQQFARLTYTPQKPFPTVARCFDAQGEKFFSYSYSPAHLPLRGAVYSSVRRHEKYLGYNISIETFLSALANPDSVVYTRPIAGTGQNVHNYYGLVCSSYVSYVHGMYYRTPCKRWANVDGICPVHTERLENLRLCDILLNPKIHIAVITGIERDENGCVRFITVSEATLPFVRVTRFPADDFRAYWLANGYRVYRNEHLDEVTYTPSPFVPLDGEDPVPPAINRVLLPDFGNRANYLLGKEPVVLSVFDEKIDRVEVFCPDGRQLSLPVCGGKAVFEPQKPGFYKARAGDSDFVEWCAVDTNVSLEKTVFSFGEPVRVHITHAEDDELAAWQFNLCSTERGCGGGWFCGERGSDFLLPPPVSAGKLTLTVIVRNAFGDCASCPIPLEVVK